MKNFIKRTKSVFLLYLSCLSSVAFGQCPQSNFSISSPVCVGSPLQITNSSSGSNSYKWDFSPGFFSNGATKLSDTLLSLAFPGDITLATQNDTNIIFISGLGDGKLHRIVYGNGPENPATLTQNLGNLGVLYQPSDIALVQEGGTWFGFITDYGSNYLYRCRFGSSLLNTPDSVTTILTNAASSFASPWSIKFANDSTGSIYAVVGNHTGGSISVLSFGNSVRNIPAVSAPVSVPGTTFVQDVILAKSCGNWYAFMAGNSSQKIIRAEFGNSLGNAPTFTTVITGGGTPSDLVLISDSSHWKLLYTDFNSFNIKKYDLGADLGNITPVFLGTDYFNGSNPKGICAYRKDNTNYIYTLYGSNNLEVFGYTNNTPVNTAISTDSVPSNIIFSQGGTYPVTLFISDANGNSSSHTDTIFVSPAPTSNFTVSDKCFGDLTLFTDSSIINTGTIISWAWNFDDGIDSGNQNTSHTYLSTGSYNVRLITTSSFGCNDTIYKTVDITPRPVASFSSPAPICSESLIQFVDQSTVSSGSITGWDWDFGNGDNSTNQSPDYSFPVDGNFLVELIVTTDAGCTDNTFSLVSVNERPHSDFSATNTCLGQAVQFTDLTTIGSSSISSRSWDFGDFATDNTANPVHTYPLSVTTYPVQLVVLAANGCADTSLQQVKINNIPVVDFSFVPAAACQLNDVSFTDLSAVSGDTISGWLWDFGDSTYSTSQNPVHNYSAAGLHTVTLIAYSPSNCPGNPVQYVVDVKESPTASFAHSTTCIGNSTHFTNNSQPAIGSTIDSVLWVFNSTDSVTIYSPDYTFPSAGNFPVKLIVVSPEGCVSSDSAMVPVHARPDASFSHGIACTGDSLQFINGSTCDVSSTISQYAWTFGDPSSGANNTSTLQNPKHKFATTMNYTTSLIVTTNFGCKDTMISTISVNQSPSANFTYSPTCLGSLMEFFNPGTSLDSLYSWNFGDGQTNQLREPAHYYAFSGTYTVVLQVTTKPGCVTSASKQVTVSPIPVADFIATPACVTSDYRFTDNSSIGTGSITSWNWNIATLPAPPPVQNPDYVFQDTGSYNVTLTITSDIGCTKSVSKTVNVHSLPVSGFSFDPQFGNPPLQIQVTDLSINGGSNAWDFGDGSGISNQPEPAHTFTDTGLFVISQYVTNASGCKDTSSQNIYVIHPVLDIAVTSDSSYFEGNYFHVVGRLENHGTREITSLQMLARLENGNTISEVLTTPIPTGPLGYYTYSFHASFVVSPGSDLKYYCIQAINPNGMEDDVPENNERCFNLTEDFISLDPYPNPFVNQVTLRFLLPQSEMMKIELIDQAGRLVKDIYEGKANKNLFEVNTNLSDVQNGMYTVKIIYRDRVISKKIVKSNHRE